MERFVEEVCSPCTVVIGYCPVTTTIGVSQGHADHKEASHIGVHRSVQITCKVEGGGSDFLLQKRRDDSCFSPVISLSLFHHSKFFSPSPALIPEMTQDREKVSEMVK